MLAESTKQYRAALRAGRKYYRDAVAQGRYPYPAVLDDILSNAKTAGRVELGELQIPAELISGTKTAGRVSALAGNFMPLLEPETEFSEKWIRLCDAHLSDEGIRDPVQCYEYLGHFYIEEGNKRVSVLLSYGAPTVPAIVTRIIPEYSDDPAVVLYYAYMRFQTVSGQYLVRMSRPEQYAGLQTALGMEPDRVWTEDERRSFSSGFVRFKTLFESLDKGVSGAFAGDALLVWLQVFRFADLKQDSEEQLREKLLRLLPDIRLAAHHENAEIAIEEAPAQNPGTSGLLSKINPFAKKITKIAFLYAFDPAVSAWTRAHEYGRQHLAQCFGDRLQISVYRIQDRQYFAAMEQAAADGIDVLFATTPSMMDACRKAAVLYKSMKIYNCSPAMPYAGVMTYYCRIFEPKFIAGAIAGVMTKSGTVGYVADYPIRGVYANINAFALGIRMTNPDARVQLRWSCLPGNPVEDFIRDGVTVISNRDATNAHNPHWSLEWGTYLMRDGTYEPLAVPCWNWGKMYEKMVQEILTGARTEPADKPVNLWWGMESGVIDLQLSSALPEGVKTLAGLLKAGIAAGGIRPFLTTMTDSSGTVRCDGIHPLSPEEIVGMNWLCENVCGETPEFGQLTPQSKDLVRSVGLEREQLQPESEEKQL